MKKSDELNDEWATPKPISNSMIMNESKYHNFLEQIKNDCSTKEIRRFLYDINLYDGYKHDHQNSMTGMLKQRFGKNYISYNNQLDAAKTEATLWGEAGIGRLETEVALELKEIRHSALAMQRVSMYLKEKKLDWDLQSVKQAIVQTCNITELKRERSKNNKLKKSTSRREQSVGYIKNLPLDEKMEILQELAEATAQTEVIDKLEILLNSQKQMNNVINICTDVLSEYAKFIYDPSLVDYTTFNYFGGLNGRF
ncbi:hypothetical protein L0668_14195 [Paraglaciecola aquimarina]|uniref:Uncharacterized protein n=1 Tax=Paraglaciecola algarum TaxID=3050085 RepID=A0ABS9D8K2_9ALTE|nr:hypothetical protein [Paraglaciecola sp. G1-23]MCF2949265.1 hypothetical protein [Paraglaciecola sp. G1-23]